MAGRAAHLGQSGFSLISAIFLLVILSALGAFMVSMSTMQQTTSILDLQGSRAYQSARAGIEWGAYQVMTPENTNPAAGGALQYVCPSGLSRMPALGGSLNGFAVTLTCVSNAYAESGNVLTAYQLTATATYGSMPSIDYVERVVMARLVTCRTTANGAPC
ncbi:MAG: hypothetical protein H7335_12740 [Massilia sp.]|nr:hypothetical protein [Massilia sp.]